MDSLLIRTDFITSEKGYQRVQSRIRNMSREEAIKLLQENVRKLNILHAVIKNNTSGQITSYKGDFE